MLQDAVLGVPVDPGYPRRAPAARLRPQDVGVDTAVGAPNLSDTAFSTTLPETAASSRRLSYYPAFKGLSGTGELARASSGGIQLPFPLPTKYRAEEEPRINARVKGKRVKERASGERLGETPPLPGGNIAEKRAGGEEPGRGGERPWEGRRTWESGEWNQSKREATLVGRGAAGVGALRESAEAGRDRPEAAIPEAAATSAPLRSHPAPRARYLTRERVPLTRCPCPLPRGGEGSPLSPLQETRRCSEAPVTHTHVPPFLGSRAGGGVTSPIHNP
ncbi:hypothetical protein AAG570_004700 [Ranatra chinensis]|uniref:Uncharacterized protein n=1 Tax=Ranatra chinensis TaxID=642074 RepID=A0ABD0YNG0_9HEMI